MDDMLLVMLMFLGVGMICIFSGVTGRKFSKKFKTEALEAVAVVEKLQKVMHTSHGKHRTRYYAYLGINSDDLPPTLRVRVTMEEYATLEEGRSVFVYYLPDNLKYIALTKEHYNYVNDCIFQNLLGVIFLLVAAVCLVLYLTAGLNM